MQAASGAKETEGRPQLLQAMIDALRVPDLRTRILFTFAMLVVFRFLAHIPVPGVDRSQLAVLFQQNQLLGFLDLFSGGAIRNLSVATMGVYPYITASIILQLMVPVIPRLQEIAKEGEAGRQRINQITHWLTVPLAAAQGYGQLVLMQSQGVVTGVGLSGALLLPTLAMVFSMTAATVFLVWLGELITEKGIGNGVSMIIFGGIVAAFPQLVGQGFLTRSDPGGLLLLGLMGVAIVLFIVVFTEAQRRIPVQYGRNIFRGGRMYRQGGASHIPLRVNSAGMIPLIFAFAVMVLPGTVASYFSNPASTSFLARAAVFFQRIFDSTGLFYWLMVFLLVVLFTFFYALVMFQQQNLAENLQKNGGFIPGIRPGKPTQEYLTRVIIRITWAGAVFLGLVAIAPYFMTLLTGVSALTLSSTALLIMVGVALDTMRQLEAQLLMRRYEGFIK